MKTEKEIEIEKLFKEIIDERIATGKSSHTNDKSAEIGIIFNKLLFSDQPDKKEIARAAVIFYEIATWISHCATQIRQYIKTHEETK